LTTDDFSITRRGGIAAAAALPLSGVEARAQRDQRKPRPPGGGAGIAPDRPSGSRIADRPNVRAGADAQVNAGSGGRSTNIVNAGGAGNTTNVNVGNVNVGNRVNYSDNRQVWVSQRQNWGNDEAAQVSRPIQGTVDVKTQRAAMTFADKKNTDRVLETSINNLTQDKAPALLHFGAEQSQPALLVRLKQPGETDRRQ